ncbi:MAG: hypothetical protein DRQ01_04565 [Ignavibacteriae bacterium]|nr:MAG: hypothetical protein DRQ01_04565 [Ignavibacteriota bacterium]
MNDWKDYIEQKFVPQEEYEFNYEERKYKEFIISSIKITHRKTKTWFYFQNAYGTWNILDRAKFGNPKTKGCYKQFENPVDFDKMGIKYLDEHLRPAFDGWSSKDYYILNFYYKSVNYPNKDFKGRGFPSFNRDFIGCLAFILFPIFFIINKLIRFKIIGEIKEKVIEPIKSS